MSQVRKVTQVPVRSGTAEVEAARTSVAQRWIARAAQAKATEPCVGLRIYQCANAEWAQCAPAQADRRIESRVSACAAGTPLISASVISALADVMVMKGVPNHLRSDHGAEFVAKDLRNWLGQDRNKDAVHRARLTVVERLLGELHLQTQGQVPKRRDLLLDEELRMLAARWRVHFNTIRPHSSFGYISPAPEDWPTNKMEHGEEVCIVGSCGYSLYI